MKNVIFFILFSLCSYSQSITVRGVNLAYDNIKHVMTLTIPKDVTITKNKGEEIEIIVSKSFSLSINGEISNPIFNFKGCTKKDFNSFGIEMLSTWKEVVKNSVYEFPDVEPDEYILQVSNVLNQKKRLNKQSDSLVIR